MTTHLHLIQTPTEFDKFIANFKRISNDGDSLLFLGDSLFQLLRNDFVNDEFSKLTENTHLIALADDLAARGITEHLKNRISSISYAQFVTLAIQAKKVVSW